jgi:hypothetical protein
MKKLGMLALMTVMCVAVFMLIMAVRPAPAAGNPWTEADGPDRIFIAVRGMQCGNVHYTVWRPYDTKLNKQLDFLRIVADGEHKGGKLTMENGEFMLDGVRCLNDGAAWPRTEQ